MGRDLYALYACTADGCSWVGTHSSCTAPDNGNGFAVYVCPQGHAGQLVYVRRPSALAVRTVVTCKSMPQPDTMLAIQTEHEPPFVWATYHPDQNGVDDGVPGNIWRNTSMLLIRSEQATRLFEFVLEDRT